MEVKLEHAIAIASTVGAFVLSVFLSCRRLDKMEKRLVDCEKKDLELDEEFRRQIEELVSSVDAIDKRFIGQDGEPRFLTATAQEKIQIAYQMLMQQRLDDHDKNIDNRFRKLDALNELLLEILPYVIRKGALAEPASKMQNEKRGNNKHANHA